MKWIRYKLASGFEKAMTFSEDNLAVVLKEAYNGEYTIDDDGEHEELKEE